MHIIDKKEKKVEYLPMNLENKNNKIKIYNGEHCLYCKCKFLIKK